MPGWLRAWLVRLLDRIDPPYGAHVQDPGEAPAGKAASPAPPGDSGWLPAPVPRSGRGQPPDYEVGRVTRPLLVVVVPTRFDAGPDALRRVHQALLAL